MRTIHEFEPFIGEHCETTATGNLLKHAGLELSEPMLFGLGEGLAYAVLNFKNMPGPFIGGRPQPDEITQNLATNLGFQVEYRKTSSKKRAWENVAPFIDLGQPVAVRIDAYYLDYFTSGIHFGGHYLAMHGYDDEHIYVVDTHQQGSNLRTNRKRFEEGRLWKGPMAPKGLTWTISLRDHNIDWPQVLRQAIVRNANSYLNPPIRNFGIKGIRKTAKLLPTWFDTVEPDALHQVGLLMERGGTGGALFRNFYRDFLFEANSHLNSPHVEIASQKFAEVAPLWTAVSNHIMSSPELGIAPLHEASALLLHIADLEETAVTELAKL